MVLSKKNNSRYNSCKVGEQEAFGGRPFPLLWHQLRKTTHVSCVDHTHAEQQQRDHTHSNTLTQRQTGCIILSYLWKWSYLHQLSKSLKLD